MTLYRITLAYDGTDFEGWQSQRPGKRTVQGVLESALGTISSCGRVVVAAAGRTDSGVHAIGQVAAFDLPVDIATDALGRALNAVLPRDVRVMAVSRATAGFHPRRAARVKLYRYELDTGPVQLPTRRRTAAHVGVLLDQDAVRNAAALYLGRHDFASLASSGGTTLTTLREVTRSDVRFVRTEELERLNVGALGVSLGHTLIYEVEAGGFLRRMVRSLVGGLLAVGKGDRSVEDLQRALSARDRSAWPPPAPARGLTLVCVRYDEGE